MSDIRKALEELVRRCDLEASVKGWGEWGELTAARAALAQPAEPAAPLALVKVFGCYDAAQIPLDVRGVYQIDAFTTDVYVQMPSGAAAPIAPAEPAALSDDERESIISTHCGDSPTRDDLRDLCRAIERAVRQA